MLVSIANSMPTSTMQAITSLEEGAVAEMTLATIAAVNSQVVATEMTLGAVSHQAAAVAAEVGARA
jgi:hypothetical protein